MSLEYAGGLFDGEGSAGVYTIKNYKEGEKPTRIRAQVQMTMCDKDSLDVMQRLFGGHVYKKKMGPANVRQPWMWIVQGQKAVDTAKVLLAYSQQERKSNQLRVVANHTMGGQRCAG